jgi:hypothetical protein
MHTAIRFLRVKALCNCCEEQGIGAFYPTASICVSCGDQGDRINDARVSKVEDKKPILSGRLWPKFASGA